MSCLRRRFRPRRLFAVLQVMVEAGTVEVGTVAAATLAAAIMAVLISAAATLAARAISAPRMRVTSHWRGMQISVTPRRLAMR